MKRQLLLILPLLLQPAWAELGNVWHLPASTQAGIPSTMRDPASPGANQTVTFYQGVYKGDGSNQTGGTFSWRINSGAWQSSGLSFHSNEGDNQFWKVDVTMPALPGMVIDYYFAPTFDNRTSPTYLHGVNQKTEDLSVARNSPSTFVLGQGIPVLTIGGLNADYTSTKLFADEVAGDSIPLDIVFKPGQSNVTNFEVFTNLNRRDRAQLDANSDGIEDGIKPPNGNLATAGDNNYFTAHTMTGAGDGIYLLTLNAQKTGAYRLTARWKVQGDPAWRWYTNSGRRDHAVVISPVDSRKINLYEVNVLNIEASGDDQASRSTFEDLFDAPNAPHPGGKWNLDYVKNLGCNWLWFQPIHPIGIEGQSYSPGSPYAVKNFFEINPLMSVANTRESAMLAFQGFVSATDNKGVGVMLDAPFNHTSPDVEVSSVWNAVFGGSVPATQQIRATEGRFFSKANNYGARADVLGNGTGDVAIAPDRGDFGKWNDVRDVFFGNYSSLVSLNPQDNDNFKNEGDFFDFNGSNFDSVTRNVWKYFAEYSLYWLDKTGVPVGADMTTQTTKGIDGLRADFGQGLPPQLWEYIINKTRTRKWNFVFMSESLDGGEVTYRSNRHFDILNENIVFPLAAANSPVDYRNIFESRRNAYGQGLVLLNNTSHDEENYIDPFDALVRYAVVSTVDGAPLVFPGQELGISRTFGYQHYETNFGKQIAHFKRFNSMTPAWNDTNYGNDQLYPVYSGIGQARLFSRALRSSNRYFLEQTAGGTHGKIFAAAKYETKNAAPATADVVFAFANTDRGWFGNGNFNVNHDTDGNGVNDYGINPDRYYNVKNIAAYTTIRSNRRDIWQWRQSPHAETDAPQPRLGSDILANGIFVAMNGVPTSESLWSSAPYEGQYLKLYDVTTPPAPTTPSAPNLYACVIGNSATFTWSSSADPEGGVSGYDLEIGTTAGASDVFSGNLTATNKTITAAYGTVLFARVRQVNYAGIPGPFSAASTAITLLDPVADSDGDGQSNDAEQSAGTNPLDPASTLRATAVTVVGSNVNVTVSTVVGKSYQLETSTTLTSGSWSSVGTPVTASGTVTTFTDPGGAGDTRRFYRARVL